MHNYTEMRKVNRQQSANSDSASRIYDLTLCGLHTSFDLLQLPGVAQEGTESCSHGLWASTENFKIHLHHASQLLYLSTQL
jgi:hypothetical protein